jgi:hypothetical protein
MNLSPDIGGLNVEQAIIQLEMPKRWFNSNADCCSNLLQYCSSNQSNRDTSNLSSRAPIHRARLCMSKTITARYVMTRYFMTDHTLNRVFKSLFLALGWQHFCLNYKIIHYSTGWSAHNTHSQSLSSSLSLKHTYASHHSLLRRPPLFTRSLVNRASYICAGDGPREMFGSPQPLSP